MNSGATTSTRGYYLLAAGVALTLWAYGASAGSLDGVYRDTKTISEVLASIPMRDKSMGYKSLAERLPNLALRVERIEVAPFTSEDIKSSAGALVKGDLDYRFNVSEPNDAVKALCPLSTRFSLLKRGKEWIPQDRTANFLVNGIDHCASPPIGKP